MTAACEAAGLRARFSFYPWTRAEIRVAEGTEFATFPFIRILGREKSFYFSEVIFASSIAIIRHRGNAGSSLVAFSGDLGVFRGYAIGTTAGAKAIIEPLKEAGANVQETETADQSFIKLERKRIDFVVEERAVALDAIHRLYPESAGDFVFMDTDFSDKNEYRLLVSKAYPESTDLIEKFNSGLRRIKDNGALARIWAKYGIGD